jgi:vancomycin aglycone glucosyltransferase
MVDAARAVGRRAILSRGWADLQLPDASPDCLLVDDVNQQALFPRVAAVVHHGGAGTTTAAARAGVPQVVVPQIYDQPYWASRVEALGIGAAHQRVQPTAASLAECLDVMLRQERQSEARRVAAGLRSDGAALAAARLALTPR